MIRNKNLLLVILFQWIIFSLFIVYPPKFLRYCALGVIVAEISGIARVRKSSGFSRCLEEIGSMEFPDLFSEEPEDKK